MRSWSPFVALLLTSSILAGCLGDEDTATPPPPVAEPAGSLSAYVQEMSPLDDNVSLVDLTSIQMRIQSPDGIELDTWVVLPPGDGPFPLVLEITPYYGGGDPLTASHLLGNVDGELGHALGFLVANDLIKHGYALGVSSVRGTGNSGGCFTQGGPTEAIDSAAVIETLAAEPWSNGNVGLIGVSYPGTTPQDVWVEAPPSLKTIVPISGISDMYRYNFVNGVHINIQGFGFNTYYHPYTSVLPVGLGLGIGATDPVGYVTGNAGEACTEQIEEQEGGVSSTVDGNKDAYWQVRDFHAELRDSWDRNGERVSVFYIHGLQDWNVKPHMMEEWLPAVQESGVPYKVWLGQWSHNWPQREDWWNVTLVAWFDEFLKEMETGILDAPAVQVQNDLGVWRHEETWPPLDVERMTMYPHSDGTLSVNVTGEGQVAYHDRNGEFVEHFIVGANSRVDPALEAAFAATGQDPAFVVFRSEPVTEELAISGMPRFVGNVTADGQRASLVLSLLEETKSGELRAFNYAAQSLNHVDDLASGSDDISGVTQQVDVSFFPQEDVLQAGSRLVLYAAGNTFPGDPGPSLQPVSDGGMITLDLAGARLELPIDRTLDVEFPQPCWEGKRGLNGEDGPGTCYLIR